MLPTLQDALKDGFGEVIIVCNMPKPCKFLSPDSLPEKVPVDLKAVDLAVHPVIGLVLQVVDADKFPQVLGFESLDPLFQSQQVGYIFHSHRGGWR